MKTFANALLILLVAGVLGCGSSADKLMKEQIQKLNEVADLMEKTGKPLDRAAEQSFNAWMEDFSRRYQALNLSKEDNKRLIEKYGPEMDRINARMRQACSKMPGVPGGPFPGMPGAFGEASTPEMPKSINERPPDNSKRTRETRSEEVLNPGERMKVQLVQQHAMQVFPPYGGGFDYTNSSFVFGSGQVIYAVRSLQKEQQGELNTYDLVNGQKNRMSVPQPAGFKATYAWESYFKNPVLAINPQGDLLCWWSREYNGDHAFAELKKGADAFTVRHASFFLEYPSRVARSPNGGWYLVQADPSGFFNIYRIQGDMKLTPLARIKQSSTLLDARFIASDDLHIFCSGRQLRCIDFDVGARNVLHDHTLLKSEQPIGTRNGMVLQGQSGSLHYVWAIEDLTSGENPQIKQPGALNGLYYQAEATDTMVKVGSGSHHRAATTGDGIVVCYTEDHTPNKVYFRVIRQGVPGPITELKIAEDRTNNLRSEYMVLYAEGDRIWFVNTLAPNTLYEFKLSDSTEP